MRAQITNDNQQATMAESMAELEIVPRPEVTAAISDDPHDLSDVSSEDEEAEEEFTAIELVRAVPVPAVQVPVFRLPVLVLICDISGIRFGTHLPVLICDKGPNRYRTTSDTTILGSVPVVPVPVGIVASY